VKLRGELEEKRKGIVKKSYCEALTGGALILT